MPSQSKVSSLSILFGALALFAPLQFSNAASAADAQSASDAQESDPSVLRICAAAHEDPYSMQDESGFENAIAKILAEAMGRKVDFVWSQKPAIYLVRDQLQKNTCDVVMGVDTGDPRVLTSKPYYRASYVFIQRKDSKFDIQSFDSPDMQKTGHIAFEAGGPAQTMLEKLNLYNRNFNYEASLTNFKSRRNQYTRIDPARIVSDIVDKKADVGIAFAPEVARYVKERNDLHMIVVPDDNTGSDGKKLPFQFDQSIAVRADDQGLMDQINAALDKAHDKITAVLKDEGIPLLKVESSDGAEKTPSKS